MPKYQKPAAINVSAGVIGAINWLNERGYVVVPAKAGGKDFKPVREFMKRCTEEPNLTYKEGYEGLITRAATLAGHRFIR